MKNIFRILLCIFSISCSSGGKHVTSAEEISEQTQTKLGPGMRALDKGDYEAAHTFFEKFLNKNPVSQFTPMAMFYDGLAQNELGQFADAANKFQTVIRLSEGKDYYLEAEALYNLGKSYEGLGEDPKALASLLDAERRAKYLSAQLANVEIPARIAGVYARQGQLAAADKYYNKAEDGLAKLKGKSSFEKQEWIPKALYGMGKISPRKITEQDFEGGLKSLRRSQSYLLRATEMNSSIWSTKAERELEFIYESAWDIIENYPLADDEDKLSALKQQQDKMISLGLILNGVLSQIKQEFIPGQESTNAPIQALHSFLDGFERKLDALISSRPVNEGLTPEAEKLQGIKRDGKVIDPEGLLEQKKKRLNEKLPTKKVKK